MNIAIVSLGCPKNQVDADCFCRALLEAGHQTVPSVAEADVAIVNTCGFIESAKSEAIEQILTACAHKAQNPELKVVVTGCLAERYRHEIATEIPEVDAVVGIGSNAALPQIIEELAVVGEAALEYYGPKQDLPLGGRRVISTPPHTAYLKIAEGCSNACSYCAIPLIRGPLRSRSLQSCVEEAQWLAQQGVKELILVAQDVTAFGLDRGTVEIASLLDALNAIDGLRWICILYAYPERITPEFVDAMARNSKVLPYLDLPIQHCNDVILKHMRRRGDQTCIRQAVSRLRQAMPGIALRTSLIVGFPGEAEAQFEELCAFVKEMRFERLGCFAYSPEEDTLAAEMPGLPPQDERERRAEVVMELQSRILLELQEQQIGETLEVLCDGPDESGRFWRCRGPADAPEIDTEVLVPIEAPLESGGFCQVQITGIDGVDLQADYVELME